MKLAIRDLEIGFGDRRVVELAELDVAAGEIVGLVGESGSGKSITALAVLGLAEAAGARVTGSIELDGRELIGAPPSQLREIRGSRIAMIFQHPVSAFNPVFRVGEIFLRALRLHGASRAKAVERARSALAEVLLPYELLNRYPHQLSGGQAQRVAVALAVALRAEVLIADEATSALDVTVQAEIVELLARLRELEGIAILFISHDLAVVGQLCDRVAVMREGRIVETGRTERVLHAPQDPYTRELIAAVPRITAGRTA
ncbi:MAG: ABC transporter ATP-binding protein [Actinobacteria bacterium]|nr:MAG: ABC transporter ATP-binding protein [Actinomycetota bacterium]